MFYCTSCKKKYKTFRYKCDCGQYLLYDKEKLEWKPRGEGVWRYESLLPTKKRISMNEGNTPLVKRKDVKGSVFMKLEGDNPTGSFKDRGTTVVISHAVNHGLNKVVTASTGNMGASVAAYAAYANVKAKVFVPKETTKEKISQIIAYNAELVGVNGSFKECVERLWHEKNYIAASGINPYYIEGEKTCGYEIYESIGVPDKIIMPMGTGGFLTAVFKAFKELKKMKKIKTLPQMIGVQAENCAPIADAWRTGYEIRVPQHAATIAAAIMVKTPFNGISAINAINESKGMALTVSDAEIIKGIKTLGKEGVFAEPASATTVAAFDKIKPKKDEKVVLVITGSGLKDPTAFIKK